MIAVTSPNIPVLLPVHSRKVESLLLEASLKRFSEFPFNLYYIDISLFYVFLLLIKDVNVFSGAASKEVRVCVTRKSKLFHGCVYHLGLETDAKLDQNHIHRDG